MSLASHEGGRRALAIELVQRGERERSLPLFHAEVRESEAGLAWLESLVLDAMRRGDLRQAGDYAAVVTALRHGTRFHPARTDEPALELPLRPPPVTLTVPKLTHDIEQLEYLRAQGLLDPALGPVLDGYRWVRDRLAAEGPEARRPPDAEESRAMGELYGRIVHVRSTPRVERALSGRFDPAEVEARYLGSPPGIVVIDDFLSAEALRDLSRFCLESTIWSENRYAHGRLGAFFEAGFNCPLLLQIAEEIRAALPAVIGDRYPLRQMWAFKYAETLPPDQSIHADFAAVNVNFWITPEDANLDPDTGGLIVYDVDAPPTWSFERYQNTAFSDLGPFLRRHGARTLYIPYRQNRAILFNSDLFHGTAPLHFRGGYEDRRINVTMLYGDREDDVHHPRLSRAEADAGDIGRAWRSASLTRARRR
ncbi:MAG: hypothetical protein U0359_18695 [Byssovorax sp.]